MTRWRVPPHVARANKYARDVVAGTIPASKWTRLACKRHLDDLERAKDDAYPYRFDAELASKPCVFAELLPHTKGEWARGVAGDPESKLIRLQPWQCFILCALFGWVNKRTGLRRFRVAYIEIPRKNGKSILAAVIGLYMLTEDGEVGAEVYSGATSEKQAWEVFRPAKQIAERTPDLREAYGIEVAAKSVYLPHDGSRFEPVIGKPGDGASPHCAIVDEYHEHPTDDLVGTMRTGMMARRQPLLLEITTAGDNLAGPCKMQRDEAEQLLDGHMQLDELFAIIYTIDDGDDWTGEIALRKANPNYGVSVYAENLRADQNEARQSARKQNRFRTKHLNIWVNAVSAWMNAHAWASCKLTGVTREQLKDLGATRFVGIDLASKWDVTAIVDLWRLDAPFVVRGELVPGPHYFVFGRYYLPESQVNDTDNEHYQRWQKENRLIVTPGDVTDYDFIEHALIEEQKVFPAAELPFDPYNATQLVTHLIDAGLNPVEYPQSMKMMSPPTKECEALVRSKRIHHDGDPILEWMISNVVVFEDAGGNIRPRRPKQQTKKKKIDGAVAMIFALGRAMTYVPPKPKLINAMSEDDFLL